MTTSAPTGVSIPEPRAAARPSPRLRALALLAAVTVFAGCAEIKSRLPQRSPPKPRPAATAPAKPRPAPTPTPAPAAAPTPAPAFVVLAPSSFDAERLRVRQALGKSAADALPATEVGYTLDVLQGRLRQIVGARGSVTRRGESLALDVSRGVTFVPGKAQLGPGAGAWVAPLGKLLGEYRQLLVAVRVNPEADAPLAQARALELAQALADAGVAKKRIVVAGTSGARRAAGPRVTLLLEPIVRPAAVRPAGR